MDYKTFNYIGALYFDSSVPDKHETPVRGSLTEQDILSALKNLAAGGGPYGKLYAAVVFDGSSVQGSEEVGRYLSSEGRSDNQALARRNYLVGVHKVPLDITRQRLHVRPRIQLLENSRWQPKLELNEYGEWVPLEERVQSERAR